MKKITLILVSVCLCLYSCNYLDTSPQDYVSPEEYYDTAEQLESALLGVYAGLTVPTLYSNNMQGRMGLDADLGYEHISGDKNTVGYYDVSTSDLKVTNYWKSAYVGIARANMLLENIGKPKMDETERDKIKGQALFLRAYYHFLLVVRFGNVPLMLSATKTAKKEDLQVKQSPAREVYLQIIKDLEDAAEILPDASEAMYGERASKSAAYGILARVCLNMAGYPVYEPGMYAKAKEAAKKVIDMDFHRLNPSYQDVFINLIQDKYDIQECIFEVGFWGTDTGTYTTVAGMIGKNNGVYYNHATLIEPGVSAGGVRATQYYYDLFEEGDLRRDWTIADYQLNTKTGEVMAPSASVWERCCGKYRRLYEINTPKAKDKTSTNMPILRYSDVLLMYAEAVAADPDNTDSQELDQAYDCLNMVRRRGFGKDVDTASEIDVPRGSKAVLLETVKDERARELGYELTRKDDIVRWGEFYRRMKYILGTVPEETSAYYESAREYFGCVETKDCLWPIPSYEIGVNRNLKQNAGW